MSGFEPETVVSATLGTARRAPVWPADSDFSPRLDASPEVLLLDALALGSASGRAGRRSGATDVTQPVDTAAAEILDPAPARAVGQLELHLTQDLAGAAAAHELVALWVQRCADSGRRVPHRLLPALLDRAVADPGLREPLAAAGGERGRWLVRSNPTWAPLVRADEPSLEWSGMSTSARRDALPGIHATDPERARELIEGSWTSAPARERQAMLTALADSLSDDDEPLLERSLDDRSSSVRKEAWRLLDALPASRRARRMADRLRPLLSQRGLLRSRLEVALPDDPDADGVRDGLTDPGPGRSARGFWLERIAAGAPLDVWTEGGRSVSGVLSDIPDDARRGVLEAVLGRADARWAQELLRDPSIDWALRIVDGRTAEQAVLMRLRSMSEATATFAPLSHLTRPWSSELSLFVAARIRRTPALARSLPPSARWLLHDDALVPLSEWSRAADDLAGSRQVRELLQYRSAVRSISEAFE